MANKTGHKSMSYTRYGYLFVAPFVIVYCVFSLYPLLNTFWFSTTKMDTSVADFWGFGNKEVYYDRYLDLSTAYGEKFTEAVGISKGDYNKVKYYFDVQDAADMVSPLKEDGINAIVTNGANDFISQKTIDALNSSLANKDLSYLDDAAIAELKAWNTDFNARNSEGDITKKIKSFNSTITDAITVEESETTTDPITADSILSSDNYAKFIETLKAGEFTAEQTAYMNYLAQATGKASLAMYFESVDSATINERVFYYVVANLVAPNAVSYDAEGKAVAIEGVKVSFEKDLVKYLKANVWSEQVNGVPSVAKLAGYADGTIALHTDEETLYTDLKSLNDMGLIQAELIEVKDGKAAVSTEPSAKNILATYRNYIDTKYQSNENELAASRQIANILDYYNNGSRSALINEGIKIDSLISYNQKLDIKKYNEFKTQIGLADKLTLDVYKNLDAKKKEDNKAKAQKSIEEYNAQYDAAKKAFEDAEAAYIAAGSVAKDESGKSTAEYKAYTAAKNAFSDIETGIATAKADIKNPKGVLTKVDSSKEYIFVGLDNFSQIFTNQTRMNIVVGAFASTATMWVIGFIPQIALALLLSAWFTDTKLKLKGLNAMKALMYLPNVITAATIAIFFRRLFSYSTGGTLSAAQQFRQLFGAKPYDFYGDPWATRFIVCFINFWMWYGNTMIVLISGITSINESIYESAQLDGANSFQTYTKITLPLLRPIILYTLVTSLIGGLQMYDIPYNINMSPAIINFNGTFIKSSQTVLMYINDQAFGKQSVKQVGIAAAISILLFIVTTILSVLIFFLMRDKDAVKAKKAMKKGGKK